MSLHDQIPSVLTHGGDSRSAISSTLATAHGHHANQSAALGLKSPEAPAEGVVEYPRAVHKKGDQKTVHTPDEHSSAVSDGWSDFPDEILEEQRYPKGPRNGYIPTDEPPLVLGNSPHPRHMHYEEPAEVEPAPEDVDKAVEQAQKEMENGSN